MPFDVDLTFDPNFEDFNFSAIFDPGLEPGRGPSSTWLYGLAYRARIKERTGAFELSDALYWTLKEGAFEAFKWKYGPRPATYEDWLYGKLKQFCEILLYEQLLVDYERPPRTKEPWKEGNFLAGRGPLVDPDLLAQAFLPEDIEEFNWTRFVNEVSRARKPFERFQNLLQERIASRRTVSADGVQRVRPSRPPRMRRSRNDQRNMLIAAWRRKDLPILEICGILDRRHFETTPQMKKHRITSWVEARTSDRRIRPGVASPALQDPDATLVAWSSARAAGRIRPSSSVVSVSCSWQRSHRYAVDRLRGWGDLAKTSASQYGTHIPYCRVVSRARRGLPQPLSNYFRPPRISRNSGYAWARCYP